MALKDHAIVEREGFKVPLLGIPPDAVLQECELCHNEFPLRDVEMTDFGQILCAKCRSAAMPNDPKLSHGANNRKRGFASKRKMKEQPPLAPARC
jgi:hypothetical protein